MADRTLEAVSSELRRKQDELIEFLADGRAKDYAHYREICGVLRGLLTAESFTRDLVRKMEYDDE